MAAAEQTFNRRAPIWQTGLPVVSSRYVLKERNLMTETYTITRLEGWTDEQWNEIVEAVEDTVVAVARDLGLDD